MSEFWSFLYGRLAKVTKPIFTYRELEQFDEADWKPLVDNGTLLRAAEPETLIVQKGREVVVRKSRGNVYGVDFSGLFARTVDLEPEDLLRYSLSLPNLAQKLVARTRFMEKELRLGVVVCCLARVEDRSGGACSPRWSFTLRMMSKS